MKKYLLFVLFVSGFVYCNAQVKVYAKFTLYNGNGVLPSENGYATSSVHANQTLITTVSSDDEQTLNIGSQSTGAGAGKVTFNPLSFSKPVGTNSPTFFVNMCAGTPFQTLEIYYYDASDKIIYLQTFKLAAIKTIAKTAASCTSGCPGIIENMTFEYGGEVITMYNYNTNGSLASTVSRGWNRVNNIRDDNPATIIQ